MKTSARHSPAAPSHGSSHSHTLSHSHSSKRHSKVGKSATPLASPRTPHSAAQGQPPAKLSPGRAPEPRASSPNYFGLIVDTPADSRESSGPAHHNWSPASSVKSFAAAIPKPVSLDANPEFEAFRKQADLNRGKSFALSTTHYVQPPQMPAPSRPKPPKRHTHASDTGSSLSIKGRPASRMDIDQDSLHDSAYVSADSKRNSESSLFPNQPRFDSPRPYDVSQTRTNLTRSEDRDPRHSLMEHRPEPPAPTLSDVKRAATLPAQPDNGPDEMISGDQLQQLLDSVDHDKLLLLDIRSIQNYAQTRIEGALNLCIPTTLLKRATFNIKKLQQTFQTGPQSEKFARWHEMDCIVVYDSHSSDKRDAVTAQNMIKKFTNEGYKGQTYILRGGFSIFQTTHPDYIDDESTAPSQGSSQRTGPMGGIAPVIGGVMLPSTVNEPNPFFSNIRQNMDLADGVGQMDLNRPSGLVSPVLPRWLRDASSVPDHGKKVADKFLHIERDEKSRMAAAYSAFNPKNGQQDSAVQLSGVEKGGKNRYKDILPFDHTRVRLGEHREGSCDYVNASHIKASRSNKRYIASQGPLPATFEDFWTVVWEQDVRVILMLTAESEGGNLKCHPYWKGRDFGAFKLKQLSEKKASLDIDKHRAQSNAVPSTHGGDFSRRRANTTTGMDATPTPSAQTQGDAPYVVIRKFALSHNSEPFAPMREITHLHFAAWPDFGSPAQPSHLLALVELANVMQRAALPVETASIVKSPGLESLPITWYDEPEQDSHARPMLVHCSAGCGRTGTFCTVDSVIDMLKRERQARNRGSKARDHEGDISMDEAVSPRTTKTFNFPSSPRHSNIERKRRSSVASPPVDTTWMHDDSLDLIQHTVEDFREQRISMVQSLRQYVLCYETVMEWITRMNERTSGTPGARQRSGSLQQPSRDH
ncbi:hypothetical protein CC79DRAFT_1274900 [Sarocladium strictum]